MELPEITTHDNWQKARAALLDKEKALTRESDALAAERRRLPMLEVTKDYAFEGPGGKVGLLDLFDGRRQLLLYRFFFDPGMGGFPEDGCVGCSMMADEFPHPAHLNARDASLVLASRASQKEIERYQARMGWSFAWVTITDDFDRDFGVHEWSGMTVFLREGDRVFKTYFTTGRGTETLGTTWGLLDLTPLGRQEDWEDSPEGRPQGPRYEWWRRHDEYDAEGSPGCRVRRRTGDEHAALAQAGTVDSPRRWRLGLRTGTRRPSSRHSRWRRLRLRLKPSSMSCAWARR